MGSFTTEINRINTSPRIGPHHDESNVKSQTNILNSITRIEREHSYSISQRYKMWNSLWRTNNWREFIWYPDWSKVNYGGRGLWSGVCWAFSISVKGNLVHDWWDLKTREVFSNRIWCPISGCYSGILESHRKGPNDQWKQLQNKKCNASVLSGANFADYSIWNLTSRKYATKSIGSSSMLYEDGWDYN